MVSFLDLAPYSTPPPFAALRALGRAHAATPLLLGAALGLHAVPLAPLKLTTGTAIYRERKSTVCKLGAL